MAKRTRTSQFTLTAKWLHWLVVFFTLSIMWYALPFSFMDPADRAEAIPVHVSIGLIIAVLTLARLAWRAISPPPPIPDQSPNWVKTGANAGHWLLYALILWQAVLGTWMAASSPVNIRFFNGFDISALAPASPELIAVMLPLHNAGAWLFTAVIVAHVLGALWHHFVLRDDVLIRMLPLGGLWQRISGEGQPADWRTPTENGLEWPIRKKGNWLERV